MQFGCSCAVVSYKSHTVQESFPDHDDGSGVISENAAFSVKPQTLGIPFGQWRSQDFSMGGGQVFEGKF
ncbi:MAG: hypothetical protein GY820_10565 [Gammaproteobacteria bacterium]|nr:hypothetical protein [Gammaproteobacteria bacterium]